MSSPTILTFHPAPYEQALAANREDTRYFLELARALYDQAVEMQREAAGLGGRLGPEPVVPYAQAEARALQMLAASTVAGMDATEYAHAYWQSLKHPWFDRVVRDHGEVRVARQRRSEEERARLDEVAKQVASALSLHVEVDRLEITAPRATQVSLDGKVAAALEAVLRVADAEALETVRETALRSAELPAPERLVALEALRLRLTQEVKERQRLEAVRLYEQKQQTLAAERIAVRLEQCRRKLDGLESAAAAPLETELAALQGLATAQTEDRAVELERKITQAAREQGLLEAAVAALRRQGYETVQVMQTLGPPEVMSAYLQDPRDEERVALLQVAADKGLVSAEVVRRAAANGSRQQKMQDREAQTRLCHAMDAVERVLAAKWKGEVKKQVPAGEAEPKVNTKIPALGGRQRVVTAALQAKSLG